MDSSKANFTLEGLVLLHQMSLLLQHAQHIEVRQLVPGEGRYARRVLVKLYATLGQRRSRYLRKLSRLIYIHGRSATEPGLTSIRVTICEGIEG